MNVLLDTCVIIDALQEREPFAGSARAILDANSMGYFDAYLTTKQLTDVYYLTRRFLHGEKGARKIIGTLMYVLKMLNTEAMDCKAALSSPLSDYEDAMLIETARREEMDGIVTRNTRDFEGAAMRIYDPETFLKKIGVEGWG